MSVYKHKKSPFYQYEFQADGRRFCGSTKETDRAAAERFEAALRAPRKAERKIRATAKVRSELRALLPEHTDRDWTAYQMVRLLDEVRGLRKAIDRVEITLERLLSGDGQQERQADDQPPVTRQ